ncbi:hypothetical protein IQ270_05135 [Microcoleus sp. LEGE 07076]|uniref:hypothetical protein n=1 Tax=Microcoleus sp. LEGE 07076 TaxID=915322 RepID=UPI00187F3571|nr:hypothetical protein [Microcoleus sp. LEGE 07076]MBE9184118.1 hypothetical protein [Microcoleus sp. LEGE 07076]
MKSDRVFSQKPGFRSPVQLPRAGIAFGLINQLKVVPALRHRFKPLGDFRAKPTPPNTSPSPRTGPSSQNIVTSCKL